jgi:superfamily II DNA or RNA helicase
MAIVKVKGNKCEIVGNYNKDLVDDELTFQMPNYWFTPSYKAGHWDGNIHFLKKNHFPIGFLQRVLNVLPEDTECLAHNPVPDIDSLAEFVTKANLTDEKRDYQYEAVKAGITHKLGIIKLATNAGKSRVIAGIVSAYPTCNFLILANRIDVLKEIENELDKFVVGDNYELATFQKAKNYDLDHVGGVIVDECPAIGADTFFKVLDSCKYASIRLGFSATPNRSDGKDYLIEAGIGQPITEIEQHELIKRGISVKPKIYIVPFNVQFLEGEIYKNAEDMLINSVIRNNLIAKLAKGRKETVILFKRIAHGELIHRLIPNSTYIDGTDTSSRREHVKKNFIDGNIDCLIASNIFDTGINLPNMKTLILAWAGKSEHGLTQKIGRAVRNFDGKEGVDIFVFYEKGHKHFNKHSKIRLNKLIEDGYDVEIYKDGK